MHAAGRAVGSRSRTRTRRPCGGRWLTRKTDYPLLRLARFLLENVAHALGLDRVHDRRAMRRALRAPFIAGLPARRPETWRELGNPRATSSAPIVSDDDVVVIDDVGNSNGPAQAGIRPSQAQTHAGRLPAPPPRRPASALGMQRMDRKPSARPRLYSPGPHRGCALSTKDQSG